ncbi:MAG: hypothetical protein HUJ80_07680 [Firmicutes bacterium]|nr:hypothetical protein [Bacillota bacterium]
MLQLEVNGGVSFIENGLLDGGHTYLNQLLPSVVYQDYNLFYANALSFSGAGLLTGKDGNVTDLQSVPGSRTNPYEVRSIRQLQYINWNSVTRSCTEAADGTNYKDFNYLVYAKTLAPKTVTTLRDITDTASASRADLYWVQSHDAEQLEGYFTPIAGTYVSSSAYSYDNTLNCWFGGNFDGRSYTLRNISISSDSFNVGVFGTTVSTGMKNIILYSNKDSVIERRDPSNRTGAYSIGGLIGVAYDYHVASAKNSDRHIENCAISGYIIRDASTGRQGLGESNIGGLLGVANINLRQCSASTLIDIACTHKNGSAVWGIFLRVGGLTGAAQGYVTDCYSGGSVVLEPEIVEAQNVSYSGAEQKNYEIYISGIAGSGFTSNYMNFTGFSGVLDGSPYIQNCYTYMQFPDDNFTGKVTGALLKRIAVTSRADRYSQPSGSVTMENCYYLDSILDMDEPNTGVTYGNNSSGLPRPLTYEQLTGAASVDGTDVLQVLNAGRSVWSKVTTAEFSGYEDGVPVFEGPAIDGVFTFPASSSLDGCNFPFPAVLQQNDLSFGTAQRPVYVTVHYGDWPQQGIYWQNARDTMDLAGCLAEDGFAYKSFRLYDAGTGTDLSRVSIQCDDGYARVVSCGSMKQDETGRRYRPVTVAALKKGSAVIVADAGNGNRAELTLEISAKLDLYITGIHTRTSGGTVEGVRNVPVRTLLHAYSTAEGRVRDYSLDPALTWSVSCDEEDLLQLKLSDSIRNQLQLTLYEDAAVSFSVEASFVYQENTYTENLFLTCAPGELLPEGDDPPLPQPAAPEPETALYTLTLCYAEDEACTFTPEPDDISLAGYDPQLFAKDGWVLLGWYEPDSEQPLLDADGVPAIEKEGILANGSFALEQDITLYAKWRRTVLTKTDRLQAGERYLIAGDDALLTGSLETVEPSPAEGLTAIEDGYLVAQGAADLDDLLWTAENNGYGYALKNNGKYLSMSTGTKKNLQLSSYARSWNYSDRNLYTTYYTTRYYLEASDSGAKIRSNSSVIQLYQLTEEIRGI